MNLANISSIMLISLLAAMSPGPDFAIVVRNCLSGKFKAGFLTSLGVAAALLVHVSYSLLGIAILIAESPLLFHIIKFIGAAYLIYLGIMLLREKSGSPKEGNGPSKKGRGPFISGFLCNLLNPKATLFVLSLFTQFIEPGMSLYEKIVLGSLFPIVVFAWFVLLSYLITHRLLQRHFARFQLIITKAMGVVLICLGIYIAIMLH